MAAIGRDAVVRATLAPLQPYLDDPDVFEVRINRFGQVVCDTNKGRAYYDAAAITESYIKRLTNTLLHYNHKPLMPINDVLLPDGERGVICLPPSVLDGTVALAFRKHGVHGLTLEDWRRDGHFDQTQNRVFDDVTKLKPVEKRLLELQESGDRATFFREAVRNKCNICVSGSTGSGKSTFTETLLQYVPEDERVVLLEDVHEVQAPNQREVVYMMYSSEEGHGRVLAKDCVKACMRLTPDRIFLTELRDDAAYSYIKNANTGHPGGIFSVHAESAAEAPERIADLIKESETGLHLDYNFILRRVRRTVDVFIHMEKRDIVDVLYDPHGKREMLAQ